MATSDRKSAADGHILIGGTGRAGTTLLVQWFTVMGFDTGFSVEEALDRVDPISNAGLEHSLSRTLEIGEPPAVRRQVAVVRTQDRRLHRAR